LVVKEAGWVRGGDQNREGKKWYNCVPSTQFCCEPNAVLKKIKSMLSVVAHACNPSTQEVKAGGSKV
jgi:hypothetical protein